MLEPIPHPLVRDGELLIREVDRPPLLAPADDPWAAAGATVPFACQGGDLGLQSLRHGLQAQRDEGVDERHRAVHTLRCRHCGQRSEAHVFHLALSVDSDDARQERLRSVCGCGVLVQRHFITQEPLRQFSTKDGTPSLEGH
jgi:hypothetical protein